MAPLSSQINRHWKWLVLAFFSYTICDTIFVTTTAEEIMSSYTSMRALDRFGNSVQLKHAREAATRHGRLVVAARCHHPSSSSDDASGGDARVVVVSVGNRPMVRSMTLPLGAEHQTSKKRNKDDQGSNNNVGMVAMCCTGIKSDADWLIRHMQKYTANVWERYDHHPLGTSALAHSVSRLLGSYQAEDLEEEWQSTIGRRKNKNSQDDLESSLSRPLGVQTCLLSTSAGRDEPNMLLVEPTGRIFKAETTESFSFLTMGKQSEVLSQRLLRSSLKEPSDLEQLLMREILETLSPSRNEVTELLVEIIGTNSGIETKILMCKNGQVKSRSGSI